MTGENRLPFLAEEILTEHSAAIEASAKATRHAIRAGQLLIEAKAAVPHGGWLAWLSDNCRLSERTAQRYMRLAAKVPGLDPAKASRVSLLPIREALRAIADQHAEVSQPEKDADWDTVWDWAGRQVAAPFNAFDLESVRRKDGGASILRNKLCDQAGVPPVVNVLFGMPENISALRLASTDDIFEALKCLVPIAKGDEASEALDIDTANLGVDDQTALLAVLHLIAQRECGRLLNEIEYRDKHWKAKSPEAFAEQVDRERETVHGALMTQLEAREARP